MFEIWPSLISANLLELKNVIDQLDPLCEGYHLDIMDNHFVPNLTWGEAFVHAIAAHTKKRLWVHLMIDAPEKFIKKLELPKNSYVTFHLETQSDIHSLIKEIRKKNLLPSAALNPHTPIEAVFPYIEHLEQILIMSVNPGRSGQELIPSTLEKILPLIHILKTKHREIPLAIDGGINRANIAHIHALGIRQFGIASGIFAYPEPEKELAYLYDMIKE